MWPFTKIEEPQDTTDAIWIGNRFYPLYCDPQLYTESIEKIKQMISNWIQQETDLEKETTFTEYSLIQAIYQTDIRSIAWASSLELFLKILTDSAISRQSIRLEDLILRISIEIPTDVLEALTGKFLYGVIYKTRNEVNREQYPGKEEWENALIQVPWIPFLPLFQEVMDSKQFLKRIAEKSQQATVVRVDPTKA